LWTQLPKQAQIRGEIRQEESTERKCAKPWWPFGIDAEQIVGRERRERESKAKVKRQKEKEFAPPRQLRRSASSIARMSMGIDLIIKRFETPDECRDMELGRFEIIRLGGMTIGRATYQPGWKWSVHVGRALGLTLCSVEHVGLVVAGEATAAFEDGRVVPLRAGELFYIPPLPHDSWVVGNVPYVSLHFLGAEKYAK